MIFMFGLWYYNKSAEMPSFLAVHPVGGNDRKIVYLTFDDGPNNGITERILDILQNYNVKATFFVVGNRIAGREGILRRIHNEGHGIGLHTYTHNYKYVYANQESFINEMIETANEINRVAGISPRIIRFPGGSYKRLNNEFLEKLHRYDFKVYDWTACAGDGVYPNLSAGQILRNSTKSADKSPFVILLLHHNSNNQTTCKALPMIISYYRNAGYEFEVITNSTPEFYFKY